MLLSQIANCLYATGLDVAIITDDSSPARIYGQAAGIPLSLALSLQKFLFLPHLLPVPQEKYPVLQHKVPNDDRDQRQRGHEDNKGLRTTISSDLIKDVK